VTTRWGDRKLVTGLAPAHALPLSGLHAMSGGPTGTKAAYLVGLINSTPVQELAEALAPGSLSQQDIEHLGLPQFPRPAAEEIAAGARRLAAVVRRMVVHQGQVWPLLPDALRLDLALSGDVTAGWAPTPARRGWGTLESVAWAVLTETGRVSGVLEDTQTDDGLFGSHLTVLFTRGQVVIDCADTGDGDLRDLVDRLIRGAGRIGPAELRALAVPVGPGALTAAWDRDAAAVGALVREYQDLRSEIDGIVDAALIV